MSRMMKKIAKLKKWTGEDDVDSAGRPIWYKRSTGAYWHSTCASGHYQTEEEIMYDKFREGTDTVAKTKTAPDRKWR
jgi:hypothetical protein